jgi:hypothetical protein
VKLRKQALPVAISTFALLAVAAPASPNTAVKIDSIPYEYTLVNSITNREPVSVSSYHFEVEPETGRVRVVVEYTYPDQMIYGGDDPVRGPEPSFAQIPGLKFDRAAHAVIFDGEGTKVVCANVTERRGLFGQHLKVANTGACSVTAVPSIHTVDTGWHLIRVRALDTFLEVR